MENTIEKTGVIRKSVLARSLGYPRFSLLSITLRKSKRFCETMRQRPDNAIFGHRRFSRHITYAEAEYIKETLGYFPIKSG